MQDGPLSSEEAGLELMRSMLGQDVLDRLSVRNERFPAWQKWTTKILFGDLWQRPQLSLSQRSMVTVSSLVALGKPHELRIHLKAALTNGVSEEQLSEVILQVGFYAGWPSAGEALNVFTEILDEMNAT